MTGQSQVPDEFDSAYLDLYAQLLLHLDDTAAKRMIDALCRAVRYRDAALVEAMNEGCGHHPCASCATREDVADALRLAADEGRNR